MKPLGIKEIFLATAITVGSQSCIKTHTIQQDTAKNIKDSIAFFDKSQKENKIEKELPPATITYDIKKLIKNKDPLVTDSKRYNLSYMLGEQDIDSIVKNYNPHIVKKYPKIVDRKRLNIRTLDSLTIPLVFHSVKQFFTPDIDTFLEENPLVVAEMKKFFTKYPAAGEKFKEDKTCIIITKLPNSTMGVAYYENGKIFLAGPSSIGNAGWYTNYPRLAGEDSKFHARSPQGGFFIIDKEPHKRSRKRDAMPNFLKFNVYTDQGNERGLGIHGGQRVTGYPLSHACFRFVHFLSDELRKQAVVTKDTLNPGTPVFAAWEQYEKELDSVAYFTKLHPKLAEKRLAKQDTTVPNKYRDIIKDRIIKHKTTKPTIQKDSLPKNIIRHNSLGKKQDSINKQQKNIIDTLKSHGNLSQ